MAGDIPILTYFGFRGLGEPIRLLFADQGVAYEDRRVGMDAEWTALQPQMQFGQMPRLEIDGRTLFQSFAILRYLGRAHGLCGEDEAQRIRCDISLEAGRDLQQTLWDHFWSPGSDTTAAAQSFESEGLGVALDKLSRWLGDAPWFGGEQLLFSDFYVVTVLDEAAAFFPTGVGRFPALAAYRERMAARPGVAAYIGSGRQPVGYGFDPARGIRSPKDRASG
jgi:glutathione S-transferase